MGSSVISRIIGTSGRLRMAQNVCENVLGSLIREFRQSRLGRIQRKEERCMKETGSRDDMGLYVAERQFQGSNCQGHQENAL
jgi:hypothetical protein